MQTWSFYKLREGKKEANLLNSKYTYSSEKLNVSLVHYIFGERLEKYVRFINNSWKGVCKTN